MEPATYLPILSLWLIIFVTSSSRKRRNKTMIANKLIHNLRTEKTQMFELAKRFIEKECWVYTFDGNYYNGTIKEVTEGAILIEKKGKTAVVNLNMVVRINEK